MVLRASLQLIRTTSFGCFQEVQSPWSSLAIVDGLKSLIIGVRLEPRLIIPGTMLSGFLSRTPISQYDDKIRTVCTHPTPLRTVYASIYAGLRPTA